MGLLGRNSAHWILADVGIWLAGHVCVPLYPTLNAETANYIIKHGDIRLMVLGKLDGIADSWKQIKDSLPPELPLIGLPQSPRTDITQWDSIIRTQAPLEKPTLPSRNRLATIVYTSGSTGRPKGVMHSFGSMMAVCESLGQLYSMSQHDRLLSYLPLAHVAERAAVEALSLYFGTQVFFSQGLETFQTDLKRARPTLFLSVPRLWTKFYLGVQDKLPLKLQRILFATPVLSGLVKRRILKELGMDAIRAAVTGSAPLPADTIQWYRKLGLELLDCYGMSENFGTSHASLPEAVRIGYVGSPAPGVSCRILNRPGFRRHLHALK
nr:AMP-binding protein [Pseudomonas sp. 25 R 14]